MPSLDCLLLDIDIEESHFPKNLINNYFNSETIIIMRHSSHTCMHVHVLTVQPMGFSHIVVYTKYQCYFSYLRSTTYHFISYHVKYKDEETLFRRKKMQVLYEPHTHVTGTIRMRITIGRVSIA